MKAFSILIMWLLAVGVSADAEIGRVAGLVGQVTVISPSGQTRTAVSGDAILVGERINVSEGARLQVLLRDETTFTLGSNAQFTLDEFLVAGDQPSVRASVGKGAFRFVSGKTAKRGPDVMKVDLPTGTIGVRGTQVAGLVNDDGSADVVLIGPGANSFGQQRGAIVVQNEVGTQDITRAGFATRMEVGAAPTTPVLAPAALINQIEGATGESLDTAVSGPRSLDQIDIEVGADSDGDGRNDEFFANEELGELWTQQFDNPSEAGSNEQIVDMMFALTGSPKEGLRNVEWDVSMGQLITQGAVSKGRSNLTRLSDARLTGSSRFELNDVDFVQRCYERNCGSYDAVTTLNFDTNTVTSQFSGEITSISLRQDESATVSADFLITRNASFEQMFDSRYTSTNTDGTIYYHWNGGDFYLTGGSLPVDDLTRTAMDGSLQTVLSNVESNLEAGQSGWVSIRSGLSFEHIEIGGRPADFPTLHSAQVDVWTYDSEGNLIRDFNGLGYTLAE